jgi:tetratricopeptide (TPR) repeat protein
VKEELLAALDFVRDAEMDFIATRPAEQRQTGSPKHWSAKDLLAHIATWKNRNIDRLEAPDNSELVAESSDIDVENAKIFANCASLSWQDVIALVQQGNERVRAYLGNLSERHLWAALPQEYFNGRLLWRVIAGDHCIHPLAHISQFYLQHGEVDQADQLQNQSIEILSRLDDMPNWQGTLLYNKACFYSIAGRTAEAIKELRRALMLAPHLAAWSQEDPDLDPIRNDPGFLALVRQKEG